MKRFGKYSETFGFIFGAALFVSGVNSAIVSSTGAPSLATYSVTHEFAERIVGAFSDNQVSARAQAEAGATNIAAVAEASAGS